jgi:hypothetical protein
MDTMLTPSASIPAQRSSRIHAKAGIESDLANLLGDHTPDGSGQAAPHRY